MDDAWRLRRRLFDLCALGIACAVIIPLLATTAPVAAEAVDPGQKAETVTEPETYRTDDYRKPVPATLRGAKVLSADDASKLWSAGSAVFIDVYPHAPKPPNLPASTVWREPQHFSIENAKWLANTGYGVLSAEAESYFKSNLERLSGGDKSKPLVFFCLRNCWMSWNAAKRALTYGYANVLWFSEGTDAWQEIGQPVAEIKPEP
ncbi:MAG: PQQ-dependent catabolism-associated CXXCW motif protein [Hyphomicrobium sp.]|nr:PQQ-dependent catabolism-associated CXXCW motif protein [Hyphomicrobium sp.]